MYTIEAEISEELPSAETADFRTLRDILAPVHTESAHMTQLVGTATLPDTFNACCEILLTEYKNVPGRKTNVLRTHNL